MLLYNAKIFNGNCFSGDTSIEIEGGRILRSGRLCGKDRCDIDMKGSIIAPGFVDTHIHGAMGWDTLDGDSESILHIAEYLLKHGTTSFLPTCASADFVQTRNFLKNTRRAMNSEFSNGAKILGAHMEGIFFNPAARGAHPEELLRPPTLRNYLEIADGCNDVVRRVSLAPELAGGGELISYLKKKNIIVSAAHTAADAASFDAAVEAGLSCSTHFMNGMVPFHKRDRNIVSRTLANDKVYAEFIPDLRHISEDAVLIIYKCKGKRKAFMCTDSVPAAGLPDGNYEFKTGKVCVEHGVIKTADRRSLAGSSVTMAEGVARIYNKLPISKADVLRMATGTPAEAMAVDDKVGFLHPGYAADFVVLDGKLGLQAVWKDGKPVQQTGEL